MSTLVAVGNATQPFDRLLRAVAAISSRLPHPIVVQRGASRISMDGCQVVDFFEMQEFEQLVQHSDVLIMHGGAGSIIRAVQFGKVPVVMPRRMLLGEHVDDHQVELVSEMEKIGYVVAAYEQGHLESAIRRSAITKTPNLNGSESRLVMAVQVQLDEWGASKKRRV